MEKVGRIVAKVIGWGLVAIVALYLVVNGGLWIMAKRAQSNAADEITARLANSVPIAQRANAQAAAGLPGLDKPYAQWVVQDCTFGTNDSGWIVGSYRQECMLKSVVAYEVSSIGAARTAVKNLPADVVGAPAPASDLTCPMVAAYAPESDTRAVGYMSVGAQFIAAKGSETYWCGTPVSLVSPTAQVISGKLAPLDPSKSWLVITRDEVLDHRDIGCARWSVIFCTNPWGDPVYGDRPA